MSFTNDIDDLTSMSEDVNYNYLQDGVSLAAPRTALVNDVIIFRYELVHTRYRVRLVAIPCCLESFLIDEKDRRDGKVRVFYSVYIAGDHYHNGKDIK